MCFYLNVYYYYYYSNGFNVFFFVKGATMSNSTCVLCHCMTQTQELLITHSILEGVRCQPYLLYWSPISCELRLLQFTAIVERWAARHHYFVARKASLHHRF